MLEETIEALETEPEDEDPQSAPREPKKYPVKHLSFDDYYESWKKLATAEGPPNATKRSDVLQARLNILEEAMER
jgi:hypothetical protein